MKALMNNIHWRAASSMLFFFLISAVFASIINADETPQNLAIGAQASAIETMGDMSPEKANDGKQDSRWSCISGHNEGIWFQLDWRQPVKVGEVIVHQYDTFTFEWDVQVREEKSTEWKTVQHFGKPGVKLPKVVPCRFAPRKITALRIANITNGPSFTEVEVYDRPFAAGIATNLASDLRGHFVGMVSDAGGYAPVEGAEVTLSGNCKTGEWNTTVRSDDKGVFLADMPLGLGSVSVSTQCKMPGFETKPAEFQLPAVRFYYGLTPPQARRNPVNLSGKWKFCPNPPEGFWQNDFIDKDWAEISVPSHWEMQGFHSDDGIGGYRLHFQAPTGEGRTKLRFDGVYSGAEVWVNGRLVATHEGGATPFEADITDIVKKGDNLLALRVREHTPTSDTLDEMSIYADFPLAGIMRPVYLFTVPEVHVGTLEITTTFDKDYRDATMAVRAVVLNESSKEFDGDLELRLAGPLPGQDEVVKSKPVAVEVGPWESVSVEIALPVKSPQKWDAEHPILYSLSSRLLKNQKAVEAYSLRTGFRQTEVRGTELLINGKPVKYRGTCHHDSHPLMGRAVTEELTRQDLVLMKEANLNAVRTSHYPPLPVLPEIADELGLYVEDEASFCWTAVAGDLRLTPQIIQLTAELLARDRNHPSVATWSLCNECWGYGYGFDRSHEWVRAADPSRPTSAGISAWEEIATMHNPIGVDLIEQYEKVKLPILWDESLCIFQGIFGSDAGEMWVDPGIRDYYAQPLRAIYDKFMKSKVTQGSMIWAWSDDLFCVPGRGLEYGRGTTRIYSLENSYLVPGRGIVGDAPWGVVDGWRRHKPEFWITKKLHSPIKVKEGPLALPSANESIRIPIENQYDFTNLSELKVKWTIGSDQGQVRSNIAPRSSGIVEIQPGRAAKSGESLTLEFEDRDGKLVDVYRLPLGQETPRLPPAEKCTPAKIRVFQETVLAGPCTTIAGRDFQLAFAHANGLLRRGLGNRQAVMLELPMLHILPLGNPLQALPNRLSWRLENLDVREEGENVRVTVRGRYKDFHGCYGITITPTGKITIDSSFTYDGDDFRAREIGLRFSVPKACDILEWDRQAEWSVYPPDHIGRPRGTAQALPQHDHVVPPTGPWSADPSPMGSNDFRSTKRKINWAAIHQANGPGVVVESDGTQNLRANVETDRISLHVNDWYGGTGGSGEWTHNYGQGKPIHKGQQIKSRVVLQITPMFPSQEAE